MKFSIHFAWGLGLAAALGGCGGGGSGTPPVIPSATTTVSGVALNSYLENAIVFLDVNGDGVLNTGEPSTTTNANGEFSFPTTDSLNGRFLVVKATTDTKMDGALLSQGMTLMTPAEKPSVISPLTTEVVAKMKNDGVSFDAAKSAVQSELGLDASLDVMKDYIKEKASNPNYAKVQNVSSVVSDLLKTVETQPASTRLASLKAEIDTKLFPILSLVKEATDVSSAKQKLADRIQEIANNSGEGSSSSNTSLGAFQTAWVNYTANSKQLGYDASLLSLNLDGIVYDQQLKLGYEQWEKAPAEFKSITIENTLLRLSTTFDGRYHDLQIQFESPINQPNLIIRSISRKTGGTESGKDGIVEKSTENIARHAFPSNASGSAVLFSGQSNGQNGSLCANTTVHYDFPDVSTFKLIVKETDFKTGENDCVASTKRPTTETFNFKVEANRIVLTSIKTEGEFETTYSRKRVTFKGVMLEGFSSPTR